MLELKSVNVSFHGHSQTIHAVRKVSINVPDGEIFGIVGTSGAGKSTLLRTINLLERPSSGEIWINGQNIASFKGEALRQIRLKTGMVFQHFNLAHSRTVHDNIALALRAANVSEDAVRRRVSDLLGLVELSDKEFAMPAQLSGGQKQRVGIARALANSPGILLCDEPTSALDLETTESILALLAGINRRLGVTVLIISHEMAVIKKICHRVAVMQEGAIVEENNVYELFSNPTHELTRELVEKSLDLSLPARITAKARGSLVRIVYQGERAEEPIISELVSAHKVRINILHGKIEYIDERPLGILIISLEGEPTEIQHALDDLRNRVARLEVIRHG